MNNDTKRKFEQRQSAYYDDARQEKYGWFQRTFTKMEKGALRGNIFLMIMTTTGSAFTMIPFYAKKTGIFLFLIMLIFPAFVSYLSSTILYLGYKSTQGKTYDEIMQKVLGKFFGLISNIVIFIHTFGSTVAIILFAFKISMSAFQEIFNMETQQQIDDFSAVYQWIYFFCIYILLIILSIFGDVEKLKKLSILGFFIIIYIMIVVMFELPSYFDYYNSIEKIEIVGFNFDRDFFTSYGFTSFLFLNQYSVIPIINNLNRLNSKRIHKVIRRTILFVAGIYTLFIFLSYFSLPNDTSQIPLIYINRQVIPGKSNIWMLIAKISFSINLVCSTLIKAHFLILYFHQLILNIKTYNQHFDVEVQDRSNRKSLEIIHEQDSELERDSVDLQSQNSQISEQEKLEQQISDTIENNQDSSKQELLERRGSMYVCLTEDLKNSKADVKVQNQNKKSKLVINIVFLTVIMALTFLLQSKLGAFVSFIGSFVGNFEIVIFPFIMIFVIDSHIHILSIWQKTLFIALGSVFVTLGFISTIMSFIQLNIVIKLIQLIQVSQEKFLKVN